jgi:hypothetical protein
MCSVAAAMLFPARAAAQPSEGLAKTASWQVAATEEVREAVFAWLDEREVDDGARASAEQLWPPDEDALTGSELLERLAQSFALADENALRLVGLCSRPRTDLVPPSQLWLTHPDTPPLVANNLRLYFGRWLAQEMLYDEAREQFEGLNPEDVVDPASLLFYQAIVYHRLLDQEAGLVALEKLLDGADQSPRRYEAVARLMQSDLADLREDTLDHIARRMEDIRRRLDFGRAGPRVRKIEDGVIESLDKLIKELEEQQQQQSAAGANQLQSSAPAQDSRIVGGKGPGQVVKKGIGSSSGWGNLPPKQREEALQQIGREFPAHYRDAIEQYFRKLASEENP